jgi:uncharacterized protein
MRMRLLFALLPLVLLADEPPTVRASGEATVSMKPDQATLNIGVVNQASTADAAAAQNAKQLTSVLEQLRKDLGAKADIRTSGYSLNPNYKYGNNTAPQITGYTASNTVQVKVDDLSKLGSIIDAATKTGSNSVNGIQFGLKNDQSARAEALKQAAQIARANAEAISAALGLRVVRVRSAESGEGGRVIPLQPQFRAMAAEARAPTPVEAGTIDLHAIVTVVLEVER